MLRSEFPVKLSIASSPNELLESFLLQYIESRPSTAPTPPQYEKKMAIDSFNVRLYLKHLQLGNTFRTSRLRDFQGSIAMIYIYEKAHTDSFNEVKTDYLVFEDFYKTVDIRPVFLAVGSDHPSHLTKQKQEVPTDSNLKFLEYPQLEVDTFTKLVQSLISNSKSFQSTTQGSCDVDFEYLYQGLQCSL